MTSRIKGFYTLPLEERKKIVASKLGVDVAALERAFESGGLSIDRAEHAIENVIGLYSLPFAVGLNFRINDRDRLIPMVVEEPSVVAAASNAARIVREGGGFYAECDEGLMIAQVELRGVEDVERARDAIEAEREALFALADASIPNI